MKKTCFFAIALVLLSMLPFTYATPLGDLIANETIQLKIYRVNAKSGQISGRAMERHLRTPPEAGVNESQPYTFFRVSQPKTLRDYFYNGRGRTLKEPIKTAIHYTEIKSINNIEIRYYSLKYIIEPKMVSITEDDSYIFRFVVKTQNGSDVPVTCYETPDSELVKLKSEVIGLGSDHGYYAVNIDPTGQMFQNCGFKFEAVNLGKENFAHYIGIINIDFSRDEVTSEKFLNEFLTKEATNTYLNNLAKQAMSTGTTDPVPPIPNVPPTIQPVDNPNPVVLPPIGNVSNPKSLYDLVSDGLIRVNMYRVNAKTGLFDGGAMPRVLWTPEEALGFDPFEGTVLEDPTRPSGDFLRLSEPWGGSWGGRQPWRTAIDESDSYCYNNMEIRYHNLKYIIEPVMIAVNEDKSYIFGFVVKKQYGSNAPVVCYKTPSGQELRLEPPSFSLGNLFGWVSEAHPMKPEPDSQLLANCGFTFEVYSWRNSGNRINAYNDYIEIRHVDFSTGEALRFLKEFVDNEQAEPYLIDSANKIIAAGGGSILGDDEDNCGDVELCGPDGTGDGIDNDCDGSIDEGCVEEDDGCGDVELCGGDGTGDGIDNDCDGQVDEGCDDDDGCGDVELCGGDGTGDGIDNDCDGQVDEGCDDDPDLPAGTYDYYFFFGEGHFDDIKSGIMPRWYCSRNNTSISDAQDELGGMGKEDLGDLFYDEYLPEGAFVMEEHDSGQEVQCSATDDFYGYDTPYKWILKRPDSCSGNAGLEQAAPYGWQIDDSGVGVEVDLG